MFMRLTRGGQEYFHIIDFAWNILTCRRENSWILLAFFFFLDSEPTEEWVFIEDDLKKLEIR